MTEQKWASESCPWPLWHYLSELGLLNERKKRLFGVGACRRVAHLMTDSRSLRMIDLCEGYADGTVSDDDLYDATEDACDAAECAERDGLPGAVALAAVAAKWLGSDDSKLGRAAEFSSEAYGFLEMIRAGAATVVIPLRQAGAIWDDPHFRAGREAEERVLADLIRELFRSPFRARTFDPSWRTSTAVGLAQAIYQDRSFDRLPILADALEDAGCDDADLLTHCRGDGPHVRGCWVVDLVLDKS